MVMREWEDGEGDLKRYRPLMRRFVALPLRPKRTGRLLTNDKRSPRRGAGVGSCGHEPLRRCCTPTDALGRGPVPLQGGAGFPICGDRGLSHGFLEVYCARRCI